MLHSKQRYLFIDWLRFLAVVFMIQGHTFDALLGARLRLHSLFFIHDFFHGFVAPMFLFTSGVAFGISTFKKWEEHITLTSHAVRRFGKFIGLLLIGYALHLPFFSLQKIVTEATPVEIASWLQVDALHCIAVTLLLAQTAVLLLSTEKKFVLFVSVLAALIIFISPMMWAAPLIDHLPLWLVSFFNASNGSWFPLFPWSAYLLCGIVFSWLFINAKEHHQAMKLMQMTVVFGVVIFTVSFILLSVPFTVYPAHDLWKANPLIVFARLGFVAVVTSGVFFAEHSVRITSQIPQIMGRESLFIYVLHLIILYGSVVNKGLQHVFLQTLSVLQAGIVFFIILSAIAGFTYGWYQFKIKYKRPAAALKFAAVSVFLILFLTRPY